MIPAGETQATFSVSTLTDALDENDETFSVDVSRDDSADTYSSEITVQDQNEAPAATFSAADGGAVAEGESACSDSNIPGDINATVPGPQDVYDGGCFASPPSFIYVSASW